MPVGVKIPEGHDGIVLKYLPIVRHQHQQTGKTHHQLEIAEGIKLWACVIIKHEK